MIIYEVRDTTDDELYYSLGLFSSITEILSYYREEFQAREGIGERSYEYDTEELSVYKRTVDEQDLYKEHIVGRIHRQVQYNSEKDEYVLSDPVLTGELVDYQ